MWHVYEAVFSLISYIMVSHALNSSVWRLCNICLELCSRIDFWYCMDINFKLCSAHILCATRHANITYTLYFKFILFSMHIQFLFSTKECVHVYSHDTASWYMYVCIIDLYVYVCISCVCLCIIIFMLYVYHDVCMCIMCNLCMYVYQTISYVHYIYLLMICIYTQYLRFSTILCC